MWEIEWDRECLGYECSLMYVCVCVCVRGLSHRLPLTVGCRLTASSDAASVILKVTLCRSLIPTSMSSSIPISSPEWQTSVLLQHIRTIYMRKYYRLLLTKNKDAILFWNLNFHAIQAPICILYKCINASIVFSCTEVGLV